MDTLTADFPAERERAPETADFSTTVYEDGMRIWTVGLVEFLVARACGSIFLDSGMALNKGININTENRPYTRIKPGSASLLRDRF